MTIDVKFLDVSNSLYEIHPIQRAAAVEGAHKKKQIEKHGKETFVDCPGIFDYKNTGWIIPAWDEFKIYCSDKATMAYAGGGTKMRPSNGQLPCPVHDSNPNGMNADITDGIPPGDKNAVKRLQPLHFTSPWVVIPEGDVSFLLLPPHYHSDIVDDFIIYPGIVDYNPRFGALNWIMSPRREGTYTIKAGTPLLHVIPIHKADYKIIMTPEKRQKPGIIASANQFYRKYVMKRSKYTVELNDDRSKETE